MPGQISGLGNVADQEAPRMWPPTGQSAQGSVVTIPFKGKFVNVDLMQAGRMIPPELAIQGLTTGRIAPAGVFSTQEEAQAAANAGGEFRQPAAQQGTPQPAEGGAPDPGFMQRLVQALGGGGQ